MPAPARYPTAATELVRSGRRARAEGLPFERWWLERVMCSPIATFRDAEPDTPCVRWPTDTLVRRQQRALIEETRETWKRAYLRFPPRRSELALTRLGTIEQVIRPPVTEQVAEALAAAGEMTLADLIHNIDAKRLAVISAVDRLLADRRAIERPRAWREPRCFVWIADDPDHPRLAALAPHEIRLELFGEAASVLYPHVLIRRALADGPLPVERLADLLGADYRSIRQIVTKLVRDGDVARLTPRNRSPTHEDIVVCLPEHAREAAAA
jgi:hypothetical protein